MSSGALNVLKIRSVLLDAADDLMRLARTAADADEDLIAATEALRKTQRRLTNARDANDVVRLVLLDNEALLKRLEDHKS